MKNNNINNSGSKFIIPLAGYIGHIYSADIHISPMIPKKRIKKPDYFKEIK